MASQANLTERQAKWFASVRASLESSTGKTIEEWVAIARTCPETGHRARLRWFKETHGLLQNRASYVLDEAFEVSKPWQAAETLIEALWADPTARAIYEAIDAAAVSIPETVRTARKGYTAWSRKVQYAAARPLKGGAVMFGLALTPDADPILAAPKNEGWSERLKARVRLETPDSLQERLPGLLKAAWERS